VPSVDEIASMIDPAAEDASAPLIATSTGTCLDPRESAAADIRLFRKIVNPETVLKASGA
jgi:deoxyribose-phosphate aldolase